MIDAPAARVGQYLRHFAHIVLAFDGELLVFMNRLQAEFKADIKLFSGIEKGRGDQFGSALQREPPAVAVGSEAFQHALGVSGGVIAVEDRVQYRDLLDAGATDQVDLLHDAVVREAGVFNARIGLAMLAERAFELAATPRFPPQEGLPLQPDQTLDERRGQRVQYRGRLGAGIGASRVMHTQYRHRRAAADHCRQRGLGETADEDVCLRVQAFQASLYIGHLWPTEDDSSLELFAQARQQRLQYALVPDVSADADIDSIMRQPFGVAQDVASDAVCRQF